MRDVGPRSRKDVGDVGDVGASEDRGGSSLCGSVARDLKLNVSMKLNVFDEARVDTVPKIVI